MNFDMRSALFWDVSQRIVVISYPHFGTTYLSHFIGFHLEFLDPWRWNRQVVPKRRYVFTTIRCVTSQKSADLIYLAAKAWNYANFARICKIKKYVKIFNSFESVGWEQSQEGRRGCGWRLSGKRTRVAEGRRGGVWNLSHESGAASAPVRSKRRKKKTVLERVLAPRGLEVSGLLMETILTFAHLQRQTHL